VILSDSVASELDLTGGAIDPGSLGKVDTFRFEEQALLSFAGELIRTGKYDEAQKLVKERHRSFWVDKSVQRQAQWAACGLMAGLGTRILESRKTIKKTGKNPKDWVEAYCAKEGWYRVDQAQQSLESLVAKMDEEPENEGALEMVRQVYEDLLQEMATGFSNALSENDWALTGLEPQTKVYSRFVESEKTPTAYFLVDAMRFIPLAAAGEDGNTTIWDAISGQQLMTLYRMGKPNSAIAFDSTGTRLATGHSDGITRVLDVATGRVLLTLPCDTSPVRNIIFSPDGKLLATAGDDGKARVWDVSKVGGEEWFNLFHKEGPIRDITYGPGGKSLATVGDGGHVRVWDASNGVSLNDMPYHLGKVSYITFNQKGDRLAGLLEDKTIGVWDTASGKALIVLPIEDQISTIVNSDIAFSIDGNRLAVCSGNRIQIYDLSAGKVLLSLSNKSGKFLSVAFSPDGNWFVTGSNTAIQLWDASTGKELHSLTNREGTAYSVALSNDGNLLAASDVDKTVRVWNVKTGNIHVTLSGHKSMVQSLAFSPDGKYLAAACSDTTVKVWDVLKAENVGNSPLTLSGHDGRINKIVFSPDSQRLATACQDGTSRVYALNIEDLMDLAKDN